MSGLFYNLGRKLGRNALPAIRRSKWIWDGLTGTEEEALRAEVALGTAMSVELRALTTPVRDEALLQLLQELVRRLSECVQEKARTFRCEVILDPSPNAMALPGGLIFISHSLLELCERDEHEVAFLLGHEMGHIIRKHTWDRMVNEAALRAASIVAARVGALGAWFQQKGMGLLRSAHSREGEFQADEIGLRLSYSAGFQPEGALRLLRRFERLESQRLELGEYLTSHPPASQRASRLENLLAKWARQRAST